MNKITLSDLAFRPYTDSGNAECFYSLYKDKFCWVGAKKSWFRWDKDETRWIEDEGSDQLAMRDMARLRYKVASKLSSNEGEGKGLKIWARKSESTAKINAALTLAKAMMKEDYEEFDRDQYLLCCENGVIDLQTGNLRPGRPEDLIHFYTKIKFDPSAKCYRWKQFLEEIFLGNQEFIDFIQKTVGYTLTGDVSEECFFICNGKGANGKSTFLGILYKLLGDFSHSASASTFKDHYGNDPIPLDVAHMCGKRLINCIEIKENATMNEEKVKALTGGAGDILKGRFLFGDEFYFSATHKIWLSVNHLPKIKGTDDGIWRRIRLIPFNVCFPPHKRDTKLIKKLEAELPGILNWAVEGCLRWQKEGLTPVDAVNKVTESFRKDSDVVAQFLKDCTIINPKEKTQASELYQAFCNWCEKVGETSLTLREFSTRMQDRGIEMRKISCNYYIGIGLLITNKKVKNKK